MVQNVKITKKQQKTLKNHNRALTVQRKKGDKLERFLIDNVKPETCPVEHFFTDNNNGLDIMARAFTIPAGIVITGALYSIECFWLLARGRLRIVEGDLTRDIEAGELLKNSVGTKNSMYAYEDSILYGFVPNPTNSRKLENIVKKVIKQPYNELLGEPANKQALTWDITHDFT